MSKSYTEQQFPEFTQGIEAFQAVQKLSSNPYPVHTRKHNEWSKGWHSEKRVQEIFKERLAPEFWADLNVNTDWSHVE